MILTALALICGCAVLSGVFAFKGNSGNAGKIIVLSLLALQLAAAGLIYREQSAAANAVNDYKQKLQAAEKLYSEKILEKEAADVTQLKADANALAQDLIGLVNRYHTRSRDARGSGYDKLFNDTMNTYREKYWQRGLALKQRFDAKGIEMKKADVSNPTNIFGLTFIVEYLTNAANSVH